MFGKGQIETTTLRVEGMSCGHCVKHVTEALKGVKGVKEASVSLESASAQVTFDAAKATRELLVKAVCAAGYQAE